MGKCALHLGLQMTFSQSQMRLFHFVGGSTSPRQKRETSCLWHGACSQWKRKWKPIVRPIDTPAAFRKTPEIPPTPLTVQVRKAKGEVLFRVRVSERPLHLTLESWMHFDEAES